MALRRYSILALTMILLAGLIGCGDDDDDPTDPVVPEDPKVASVAVSPASVDFTAIGEDAQFSAVAFDQDGAVIDTVFVWQSSDLDVVSVDDDGMAVATGLGIAEIYATAGSAADTASVTVSMTSGPVRHWISAGSGDWEEAANWTDSEVPGEGDVAVIDVDGTYTVTMNDDVVVEALVLGNDSGAPTLDTNDYQLRLTTGGLFPGAELLVEDEIVLQGDFAWNGGDIGGGGTVEIEHSAELHVLGNPVELDATINNNGTITAHAGSSLRVNGMLDNNGGGLVELQGDATLTVQNDGDFSNSGTIHKSQGTDEASIFASSAEFSSSGSILVDAGSLVISGGSLSGLIDIDGDAQLRQSSQTEFRSVNSQGDGPFIIGGRVTLGTYANQIVSFRHLILDSSSTPAVVGEAGLLIDHSFVWRRGVVHELGSLTTQIGSLTTFGSAGLKALSATDWTIFGQVAGDSNVDLTLDNGSIVSVENAGHWDQVGGGTIATGVGDAGRFDVLSSFGKYGAGTFTVDAPFNCSGTLDLRDGALAVEGAFSLFDSGVITGGGTSDLATNPRLIVLDAPSVVMRGTIRPDLDGQPARLDIQGGVVLETTCRIELDVATRGAFNTESVFFLTSGQVFGGTLALNVVQFPNEDEDYRVIYSTLGIGNFTEITGGEVFYEIIEDNTGVVCRR